jgi:hypothetical protein
MGGVADGDGGDVRGGAHYVDVRGNRAGDVLVEVVGGVDFGTRRGRRVYVNQTAVSR